MKDPVLLQLSSSTELPIVHLERIGEVLSVDNPLPGSLENTNPSRIESERVGFQPMSAKFGPGRDSDFEKIDDALQNVFNNIDLIEPFDRITTAINSLIERDSRFK